MIHLPWLELLVRFACRVVLVDHGWSDLLLVLTRSYPVPSSSGCLMGSTGHLAREKTLLSASTKPPARRAHSGGFGRTLNIVAHGARAGSTWHRKLGERVPPHHPRFTPSTLDSTAGIDQAESTQAPATPSAIRS
jgi:hypothetical protein